MDIITSRIYKLVQLKKCQKIDLQQAARWNGRDLRTFIKIAPIVLYDLQGIAKNLIDCCLLEAQVMWYLTNPDWCKKLVPDFTTTYEKQRFFFIYKFLYN